MLPLPPRIASRSTLTLLVCFAWTSAQEPVPAPQTAAPDTPKHSAWKDPTDGWLDLSEMLAKPGHFVPVVMPITEPAVGFGLAGAAVFLRPRREAGAQGFARPNITAAGGMFTSNGSWGLLAADSSAWKNDRIETFIAGGHGTINLKYYGEAEGSGPALEYGLGMSGGVINSKFRLGSSRFMAAARYLFMEVSAAPAGNSTDQPAMTPPQEIGRTDRLAGPGLSLIYDSRNNILTPTKGIYSESSYSYFDPSFGGSLNYQRVGQVAIGYKPLGTRWTLGLRGDANFSFGNPVFYARPYVSLRGIPAMRYQRQHVAQTETELRWQAWKRFSVIGFGGAAVAWNTAGPFTRTITTGAGGGGFRYLLARKFGLHYGVDVARGPEDWAIYFQFGSAWMRP